MENDQGSRTNRHDEDEASSVSRHDTRLTNFLSSLFVTRTSTVICYLSQSVRSNGQVGLATADKHCMLIWYRHGRLSILLFCIGFCIFLHRSSFFYGTSFGRGRSGFLLIYGDAHAFQLVLDYHGSKQSNS